MQQFSVCKNMNQNSNKAYPYLLNVQSSILDGLETRLVIPLAPQSEFARQSIERLTPMIRIRNKDYLVLTQQMAAISIKALGDVVADASKYRQPILSAIDFLVMGF